MTQRRLLWVRGLLPLFLLGAVVLLLFRIGPLGVFRTAFPPVEELTLQRVELVPGEVVVHVVNGGPEAVTVAQVMIDEAFWQHEVVPGRTIPRLGRARVVVPYPWVEGELHEVTLVTSTGLTFSKTIEVATETPRFDGRTIVSFALLGFYAGVVPVFLGLLWFPFLSRLPEKWIHFFLSLTVGLLIFLGVDALEEAFEAAAVVPSAFQGVGLITLGFLTSLLGIMAVNSFLRGTGHDAGGNHLMVAYLIAAGIGLHNLGEGLAIGSAYAVGEITLGTFLVVGFMLHNSTEGLGIVAPVARTGLSIRHLAWLGLIAGAPTIVGTWIGGFSYSPISSTLFLALGAGAIFQVVYVLGRLMMRESPTGLATVWNVAGFVLGLVIMYSTALLVVA